MIDWERQIMPANEMLQKLGESLSSIATAKSVFGDPVQIGGKTVIPVARVLLGFGGGFGTGPGPRGPAADGNAEGGGGGGGVQAIPAGALEITASGTRFVPIHDMRWLAAAFSAGLILGAVFLGRRRK